MLCVLSVSLCAVSAVCCVNALCVNMLCVWCVSAVSGCMSICAVSVYDVSVSYGQLYRGVPFSLHVLCYFWEAQKLELFAIAKLGFEGL